MKTSVAQASTRPASAKPRLPGRPPGKSASRENFDQRRLELLKAAARTFNTKGFHVATLEDIASELGVTKPAIYYYASSKDELLFACGQLAFDALHVALSQTDKDTFGLARLKYFFRRYGETICEDFGRCLVLTRPGDLAPTTRPKSLSGRRRLNNAVRGMISDGIKDGSILPCDDRALAMAMFDAFNGLARWYDPKGPSNLQTVIDQFFSIFLRGIEARR